MLVSESEQGFLLLLGRSAAGVGGVDGFFGLEEDFGVGGFFWLEVDFGVEGGLGTKNDEKEVSFCIELDIPACSKSMI